MRTTKSTLGPLLTGLQACLWAVLALCVGSAFGSFTQSPLDLPQAESLFLAKPAEGQRVYFNARFYDAERGSFIGRDPKLQFWTPYSYVGNGPLVGTDPTGEDIGYSGDAIQIADSKIFVKMVQSTPRGAILVEALECTDALFEIRQIDISYKVDQSISYNPSTKIIKYDRYNLINTPTDGGLMPMAPEIQIGHELGHAFDAIRGQLDIKGYISDPAIKMEIEIRNIHENENPIRKSLNYPLRLESERGYQTYPMLFIR